MREAVRPLAAPSSTSPRSGSGCGLSGTHARHVLAKGCSIDLHPRVFRRGRAAQTTVGLAGVILLTRPTQALSRQSEYLLLVRSSFARYLADWLLDAAQEFSTAEISRPPPPIPSAVRSSAMSATPQVVIIGAGIVGANLADELTQRGWDRITVVDQGPLPLTGGSTSHAPGLVFQTNASKTMTELATYTVNKLKSIDVDGAWCFNQVGGLEIATTPERLADLHRRQGWATSWGVQAQVIDADECVATAPAGGPRPDPRRPAHSHRRVGQGHPRGRGADPARAGPRSGVPGQHPGNRHRAHRRPGHRGPHRRGVISADIVVSCAGFWGVELGEMVGMAVPLLPLAHQFAWTGQVPDLVGRNTELQEAGLPILRHQDQDLYYRERGGLPGHRLLRPPADAGGPAHDSTRTAM